MKHTKRSLAYSLISLLLCASMLVGTTFAWFTDSVSSTNNLIVAGNLDIELQYKTANGKWADVAANTNVFAEDTLWEPGHTEVVYLRIKNAGTLALKYQLGVNVASEDGSVNVYGEDFKLSDYIYFGYVETNAEVSYANRDAARAAAQNVKKISTGYTKFDTMLAGADDVYVTLVVYMPEEVGNDANYAKGEKVPTIHLGINLYATQFTKESDSFGSDYDAYAKHPLADLNFTATQSIADVVENGALTQAVTVGNASGEIFADIPSDVKLAEGAQALELVVQAMKESEADIRLETGESKQSFNIEVVGIAEDNTVPMLITVENMFKPHLNTTSVTMYHVENGQTVEMTAVSMADLDEHNEFYYDVNTGTVILCVANFSEYVSVENDLNPWVGGFDIDWYKENPDAKEFTITTAQELAGLGVIVDGGFNKKDENGAVVWVAIDHVDTFEGKTIYLAEDIDLGNATGDPVSFNPIGCGYVSGVGNSGGVDGRAFMGTFDGQNHYIYNLYQNGWDIGLEYCNLGGGLFASIANGTVQNLTISGANIVMECVEQGVLVGLSQGNCTYKNIKIYNSKVANYQRATGGLIGEVSAMPDGDNVVTISDVVIGPDVVVGSLWGDFDAPVGGVIGARWDDSNATIIKMTNVTVAARLDVYNDVTSTYQWYAYRRAGMLIGNTEQTAEDNSHLAAATFLECTNVKVYYGDWVNYHYCEFSNANPSWPFVRVEAGENCSAFSNPRWGIATNTKGEKVTPENHSKEDRTFHEDGDDCYVHLPFGQLYGGGQGVYGGGQDDNYVSTHTGVEIVMYDYTVTYIDRGNVLRADAVNNSEKHTLETGWYSAEGKLFECWIDAYLNKVGTIEAKNTKDYTVYPKWNNIYEVHFLTANETLVYWGLFTSQGILEMYDANNYLVDDYSKLTPPYIGEGYTGTWKTKEKDEFSIEMLLKKSENVVFYASYESDVLNLEASITDGIQDSYSVTGVKVSELPHVEIPSSINGYPVTTISKNAFAGYEDLHGIKIPATVTSIEANALEDGPNWLGGGRSTITIYYEGTPEQMRQYMDVFYQNNTNYKNFNGIVYNGKDTYVDQTVTGGTIFKSSWDNGLGEGSRIFFLDGNGKVDLEKGYWELYKKWTEFTWVYHGPDTYGGRGCALYNQNKTCTSGNTSGGATNYYGNCDCNDSNLCPKTHRPDRAYWYYDDACKMPIYKTDGTKYIYADDGTVLNP